METTQENSKTIKWNDFLDVNENDDFEFKLLDDGLGFHQQEEIERKTSVVRKKVPSVPNLKASPRKGMTSTRRPQRNMTRMEDIARAKKAMAMPEVSMPEVAMPEIAMPEVSVRTGYPKTQTSSLRQAQEQKFAEKKVEKAERKVTKTKKKLKLASVEMRFSAFILDAIFLAVGASLFVLAGSFTLGITVDSFAKALIEPQYLPLVAGLAVSFYLFYFSLLDCDQSFGKQVMGIKVIDKSSRKTARFMQNATRAFLTLLVLPVLFSLQDSMSDTEVIKCN
jgi:hypothetical protein